MRVRRRHLLRRIRGGDALGDQARICLTRHQGGTCLALPERFFFQVEPQPSHPRAWVGTMTLEAVFGKDRANLTLEIDDLPAWGGGEQREKKDGQTQQATRQVSLRRSGLRP